MPYYFRAIAVDYDGTLTDGPTPAPDVLAAVADIRASGRKVILCTGRILSELRAEWPAVDEPFDAIVAENGSVIARAENPERATTTAVPAELAAALRRRGVPLRVGTALIATDGEFAPIVLDEITRLGLDSQIVRNRAALMVLPAGVTKGTGLIEALGELGISRHSTIGIGDAENDHALLDACELGVAVNNAVPSLQARADVVLAEPAGAGVAAFLRGPILNGQITVPARRWRVSVGTRADGSEVWISGSRVNVLIAGATGTGKSYLAGLLAERLVALGYVVVVFDPEGDHVALGRLRGVLTLGDGARQPGTDELTQLIRHRFSSLVVDMSLMSPAEKLAYYRRAIEALQQLRAATGLPHWVFLEEADQLLAGRALPEDEEDVRVPPYGFCLVTHQPRRLPENVLEQVDVVLALRGAETYARIPPTDGNAQRRAVMEMFELTSEHALFADRDGSYPFRISDRCVEHVRHWHKYLEGELPVQHRFHFRNGRGLTGRAASNIVEFHRELKTTRPEVVAHHLRESDVSKWVRDVIGDDCLASSVRGIERWYQTEDGAGLDVGRDAVLRAIEDRFGSVDDGAGGG